MPKIKTKRDDILRPKEVEEMFSNANENWLKCLIALLWIFGKRISEIICLRKQHFSIDENYLSVRFKVLKRREKEKSGVPPRFVKRIRIDHPYTKYITDYISKIQSGFVFSSVRSSSGHISRQHAYNKIKAVNPEAWCHLFRESLATIMAEKGATEEELLHWFDWSGFQSAHKYVKRGTRLTKKWSDRRF